MSVRNVPNMSTRKRSDDLAISRTSLRRIKKLDLKLHPYKIQLVQELKPNEERIIVDTIFERFKNFNNMFSTDEARFHLNGHLNKQNCRFWSRENPKLKYQRPLDSPKVRFGAAISFKGHYRSILLWKYTRQFCNS